MKGEQKQLLIIILLLFGLTGWNIGQEAQLIISIHSFNDTIQISYPNNHKITETQILTSHVPIIITNNNQFTPQGFLGSGTSEDPYKIENLNITNTNDDLISISNTTAHFIIKNNLLDGLTTATSGISLSNVKHCTIEHNIIRSNEDGIKAVNTYSSIFHNNSIYLNRRIGCFLVKATNCTLTSNTIHDNLANGIHLKDTSNTTIISNNIYNHQYGEYYYSSILLDNSSKVHIINNSLFDNHYGINLLTSVIDNLIVNNTIYDNQLHGIRLEYATRTTILHNTIINNKLYGLLLNNNVGIRNENSSHNLIEVNTIYNNTWHGVFCKYINYTKILQNTVYNSNTSGIFLRYGHHATIANNTCYRNSMIIQPIDDDFQSAGITVAVHQAFVFNNSVFQNNDNGIIVYEAEDTNISRNIIKGNRRHGISIGYSTKSLFENNQVYDNNGTGFLSGSLSNESSFTLNLVFNNVEWGLEITEESHTNTINYNDFLNNNAGGLQATDDGSTNTFEQNYWSDWSGTGSYDIDGTVGNHDALPLKNPYHLLAPIITNISAETLTLDGNVIIEWNVSKDTFGHSFTYAILYSPDNGQSWTTIASNLITTNYTIDTTTIPDATEILLKVQAVDSIGFIAQTIYSETFLVLNDLSQPIVVSPNGGETLNETVIIEWEGSLDPSGHSITYSVYYSSDNGITWTLLASDLTSTSYSWDTTSIPNGLSYLIKVTATCSEGETSEDISDSTFTIQNPTIVPGMTLLMVLLTLGIMITIRKSKKR